MDANKEIGNRLSQDLWFAHNLLSLIFPFLKVPDILRCSEVCKLWNSIAKNPIYWRAVNIENCTLHLSRMTEFLKEMNTATLQLQSTNSIVACDSLSMIPSLKALEIHEAPSGVIALLAEKNPSLEFFKATYIYSNAAVDLSYIHRMPNLRVIKINANRNLQNFENLMLNLGNNIKNLRFMDVENLNFDMSRVSNDPKINDTLETLALGNLHCFTRKIILPRLSHDFPSLLSYFSALKKLTLDYCNIWNAVPILSVIKDMKTLISLELLDIDVPDAFVTGISMCTNLKELTILPSTHKASMARFNSNIYNGVVSLKNSLKTFRWKFSYKYMVHFVKTEEVGYSVPILKDTLGNGETLIQVQHLKSNLQNKMTHTEIIFVLPLIKCDMHVDGKIEFFTI